MERTNFENLRAYQLAEQLSRMLLGKPCYAGITSRGERQAKQLVAPWTGRCKRAEGTSRAKHLANRRFGILRRCSTEPVIGSARIRRQRISSAEMDSRGV